MTSEDEELIKSQVKEAKAKIEAESAQWEVDNPLLKEEPEEDGLVKVARQEDAEVKSVGDDTNKQERFEQDIPSTINRHDPPANDEHKKTETSEAASHHGAEGEEMVEGEEDTVIY